MMDQQDRKTVESLQDALSDILCRPLETWEKDACRLHFDKVKEIFAQHRARP